MKKTTKRTTKRKSQEQINEMYPDEYYTRQSRVDSFMIVTTIVWIVTAIALGLLAYLFIFE